MKKKILISGVALMLLTGTAGATGNPQFFSALQGIQAESLSNLEMEQTKGAINWKLIGDLAKMWAGLGTAMAQTASGNYPGAVQSTVGSLMNALLPAYLDYKNAKISEKQAKSQLKATMKKYDQLRKTNPRLPKINI